MDKKVVYPQDMNRLYTMRKPEKPEEERGKMGYALIHRYNNYNYMWDRL